MKAILLLMAVGFTMWAQPAPDVNELVKRTGERFFALENFDVELKIGLLGDHPMERRMRLARREDGSLLHDSKTGYITIVRDGRLIRIRGQYKEWTETAAEGPEMRSLKGVFEQQITRFEKLVAVEFEIEFVKWEELKRGSKRVKCAVVRMWPRRQADGIWKETLWIEPDEALVWRSLWEETRVGAGVMSTARQVDYDWRATAAPIGDGVFDSEKLKKYRKVDKFTSSAGMGATLPSKVGP
ncbi:MAG TPA: hypothetical protein PLZ95_18175 [Bryobacteraceae bacterium]|nr:hypothetical protein [Bryobacteraceae bacterium]